MVLLSTGALGASCYLGRSFVPPAPMGMTAGGIGHGTAGSYECVPGPVRQMREEEVNGLRCVSEISEPGGINDQVVHIWSHRGHELARKVPTNMPSCPGEILRSELRDDELPKSLHGKWSCRVETEDGQLVGLMNFVVKKSGRPKPSPGGDAGVIGTVSIDAGAPDAGTQEADASVSLDARSSDAAP